MSLSTLIVQREIASIREVEEALARQVLYGGDLVTNLLEVSRPDETQLGLVVAESHGLPPAPPGELPRADDEALRLVAAEVAIERTFVPLSVDRGGLTVAVVEPLAAEVEQELSFALAMPILQKCASLVRITQAISREYGVELDLRLARLLERLASPGTGGARSWPPRRGADMMLGAPRPPSIVPARLHSGAPDAAVPTAPEAGAQILIRQAASSMRPLRRRRGAFTLDMARADLEDAAERDTIFDLLFEFARQYFDYTAVFVVHGEIAEGRDAFGEGAPREKVARIGVPLDLPSVLSDCRQHKTLIQRTPASEGLDATLMNDLGRSGKTPWFVFPVIVRTRVVGLLLGDGGESGIDEGALGEVDDIVVHAARAFERLIVRRKLGGSVTPAAKTDSVPARATASQSPPTAMSELSHRPAIEELAPPIRELITETSSERHASARPPSRSQEPPPPVDAVTHVLPPVMGVDVVSFGAHGMASDPPPPPNIVAVRRPSGRPIPREEPESKTRIPVLTAPSNLGGAAQQAILAGGTPAPGRARVRRGEAPKLNFRPVSGSLPAVDKPSAPAPAAESPAPMLARPVTIVEASPSGAGQPAVVDEPLAEVVEPLAAAAPPATEHEPDTTRDALAPVASVASAAPVTTVDPEVTAAPVDAPAAASAPEPSSAAPVTPTSQRKMPISEQQVSVAAHRPPTSRSDLAQVLPSVIVDVASEYVGLVESVVVGAGSSSADGQAADEAEAELLRAGGHAMPAIMARFPGPVTMELERLDHGQLPRVAECGPVLRLVASQRRTALPFVLAHVEDQDVEKRFWATYLLTELVYPDVLEPLIARIFDDSPRVRRVARAAGRAFAEAHAASIIERLELIANDATESRERRLLACEALGETRDPRAVAALIPVLDGSDSQIVSSARSALSLVTRQDFGASTTKWLAWWGGNKERHRLEWLIDALMHEQGALRAAASEELKTTTKEYFGYYDDLPKRERERAQARYRDWWSSVGRVRFGRTSARG